MYSPQNKIYANGFLKRIVGVHSPDFSLGCKNLPENKDYWGN
jgi:hypothetical protein